MISKDQFHCIIVTGLPGSGKTTCGKLLSKRLEYGFIDSDKLIERCEGMQVRDIFSIMGEAHFRTMERDLLRSIEKRLSSTLRESEPEYIQTTGLEGSVAAEILTAVKAKGLVLSVGGGMPEPEENRERLKRLGTVVYLASDPKDIAARLKQDGMRPLLSQNETEDDAKVSFQNKKASITARCNKDPRRDELVIGLDSLKSTPDNQLQPAPDNAASQLQQRLQELLDRRRQAYECADITIDTSGLAPHQIVNRLQEALKTHQQIL